MTLNFLKNGKCRLLAAFFILLPFIVTPQTPGDVAQNYGATPITKFNGFVWAIAIQSDGKSIVGGGFTQFNGATENGIIRLNTDGTKDTSFNTGTGFTSTTSSADIRAIAIQPDGKIILGGGFTDYNGIAQNKIIRLNPNGTKDTSFNIGTGFTGFVNLIKVLPSGKIIIGGGFTSFNGETHNNIIRLNADGSKDTSFNTGTGFNYFVYTLALQSDGKIIVGGDFTSYKGITENRIIRLNSDGTKDVSFNAGTGFENIVRTILIQPDGKILAGGEFLTYKDVPEKCIVRLHANGNKDTAFNTGAGFTFSVESLALQPDGKIIAGGVFITFNNIDENKIIRLNPNGTKDTSFSTGLGFDYQVLAIAIQPDGKIIIGGAFTSYKGLPAYGIVRLNTDASADSTFDTIIVGLGFNRMVRSIAVQPDGKIILGGEFTIYNNTTENRIIRLHSNGTKDTSFNTESGFNGVVNAVTLQPDGKLIVGGNFMQYKGVAQNRLIRLNADGSKDASFTIGSGFLNSVYAIMLQPDGKIIVGGDFLSYNGTSSHKIVRLNNDGTTDTSFAIGTGFNEEVRAIALQSDGKIIIGGDFTSYKGLSQYRLIRLNSDGAKDPSFNIEYGFNGTIYSVATQLDGKIVVGGSYNLYKGITQNYLIRLNSDGTKDNSFNLGTGFSNGIMSVALKPDGKILVGGHFKTYQNITENNIISLNSDGTKDSSFNIGTGFNNYVNAISIHSDGKITVGGGFNFYNGTASAQLITLFGDSLLSTEDFHEINTISLWPNPAQNILNISNLNNVSTNVRIYNLYGKLVYENTNPNAIIDISSFESGMYIVHLKTPNENFVKKFIKS